MNISKRKTEDDFGEVGTRGHWGTRCEYEENVPFLFQVVPVIPFNVVPPKFKMHPAALDILQFYVLFQIWLSTIKEKQNQT